MPPNTYNSRRTTRSSTQVQQQKQQEDTNRKVETELMRREPSLCQKCDYLTARIGCHLCQDCYLEQRIEKDKAMIICQGCP
jgi:hypothetical protein